MPQLVTEQDSHQRQREEEPPEQLGGVHADRQRDPEPGELEPVQAEGGAGEEVRPGEQQDDGGWRVDGRKIFGTLSPVWTRFGIHAADNSDPDNPKIVQGLQQLSKWEDGIEPAIDVTLAGRYYERFADHAVSVAIRVVFLVTGSWHDEQVPLSDAGRVHRAEP